MTNLEESIYQLICTLEYFPGKSVDELKSVEWLRNTSIDGISLWLQQGIRRGYIYDKVRKDGELIYYASAKGKKQRDKFI